ncbi:MAG: phospholipase D-like domain-containing protein [Pseudomonadales bacterium]
MNETQETIQRVLENVLGIPFTDGNRVDVLRNGDEIFPAMLEAIGAAQSRIELLTFIYWKGDIAQRFALALAERARAGVHVRVVLDAVGAAEMAESLLRTMREAGVDVQWFRPVTRWTLWQMDNRTHRKVLVVDGLVGFTGGVGIAAEWEGDARNEREWRDTHFRIIGPAVQGLQGAFYSNWAETGRRLYEPPDRLPRPRRQAVGDARLQVVRTTASTGWSDIATIVELLIELGRQRLRIASAYFVPDEQTIANLNRAVARGVEVDVMMPGAHTDQRVSQLAGEAEFMRLLDGGVRLWKYQRSMLHTKIMTIDAAVACVGSANFNQRSMRKDDELAVVVLDAEVVRKLDGHFEADLQHCEPIRPEQWRRRGPVQRLLEVVVRPVKSQS